MHTSLRLSRWFFSALLGVLLASFARAAEPPVDLFASADGWKVVASDGVQLSIHADSDAAGPCLRLDFDFVSGAGYAGIRRPWPLDLPDNYEFTFQVRSTLPENNLEFKLADPSGDNVWWNNRRNFEFPAAWQTLVNKKRHIAFAWGPSAGAPLKQLGALEFVVASVRGGKGSLWLRDLRFRPLPPSAPYTATPVASARGSESGDPQAVLDAANTKPLRWTASARKSDASWTVDFGTLREFGGMIVRWDDLNSPAGFTVAVSDDGKLFTPIRTVSAARGGTFRLRLPDSQCRFVQLALAAPPPAAGTPVDLLHVGFLPVETGASDNDFAKATAAASPKGLYPKAILGQQQSNWTIIGRYSGNAESLINEEGQIELGKRQGSIEPFVFTDGKLLTWADGTHTQSLTDAYLPIPTVERQMDGLRLAITAFAADRPTGELMIRYALTCTADRPRSGKLLLAVRPFQVLPPWQWLNTLGGAARIDTAAVANKDLLTINRTRPIVLLTPGVTAGVASSDQGDITRWLTEGQIPPDRETSDPQGKASAAASWPFTLDPGQTAEFIVSFPLLDPGEEGSQIVHSPDAAADFRRELELTARVWHTVLDPVGFTVPKSAAWLIESVRANMAYILINKDGPRLQPGSRSYERSWIRDGSMTSLALLQMGRSLEPREFVEWYAANQFKSGKVPCVVDSRGPDPVAENDSHGQLIFAIADIYRFNRDEKWARAQFPHVQSAVEYLRSLIRERSTGAFADPASAATRQEQGKPPVPIGAFHGLLPESISHEGYSSKPMHSYWDCYFALRGLNDAVYLAQSLGEAELAESWSALRDQFKADLGHSLALAMKTHGIDYLPGCVELGDFDATSTAAGLSPCDVLASLPEVPRTALTRTFDRYWDFFAARRADADRKWVDYTPYELRVVGAMVMLGQRERAWQMLEWFHQDQHPMGWRHWAEIVHSDRSKPAWIGDMPHTWVGSDFIRSVCAMFVYADEAAGSLVLLAGIPAQWWLGDEAFGFHDINTVHGRISCQATFKTIGAGEKSVRMIELNLSGQVNPADLPGGLVISLPPELDKASVQVGGIPAKRTTSGAVVIKTLPARINIASVR